MIRATAPGGCAIIGDPSDMFGGSVVACSTRERAHCTLDNSIVRKQITVEVSGEKATISGTADLALQGDDLDTARAVLSALEVLSTGAPPFSLCASCNPALNSSLGGQAAMLTAIVGAVLPHLGLRLNPYEIAELVRRIESDLLNTPCGFVDQYIASFGGLSFMDFRGKSCLAPLAEEAPFATVEPLYSYVADLPILIANVGESQSGRGASRERWCDDGPDRARARQKLARHALLAKKALLGEQWETLAELANRDHALQQEVAGSHEIADRLVQTALESGAIGARRLCSGESIVALTLNPEQTVKALQDAGAKEILFPVPSRGLTVEIAS